MRLATIQTAINMHLSTEVQVYFRRAGHTDWEKMTDQTTVGDLYKSVCAIGVDSHIPDPLGTDPESL